MLKLFEIPLQMPEGERLHTSMGSLFHGALTDFSVPFLVTFFCSL